MNNIRILVCALWGVFNAVREENERVGIAEEIDRREFILFNEFISLNNLVDLALCGRQFTWHRPDGSCKSCLDRLLINSELLLKWPNAKLKTFNRSISNHCPIFTNLGKQY